MVAVTKLVALLAVVACSKADEPTPGAVADPWATPRTAPATGDDPWAAKSPPPVETPPPSSTLAGSYQCQQIRYGTSVNGIRQSTYVSSALGVFEVDGDGTYRSESYPSKGTGRVSATGTTVTFEGGPYAGSVGEAGRIESGPYIRFSENLTDTPAPSLRFNDHMCYRK